MSSNEHYPSRSTQPQTHVHELDGNVRFVEKGSELRALLKAARVNDAKSVPGGGRKVFWLEVRGKSLVRGKPPVSIMSWATPSPRNAALWSQLQISPTHRRRVRLNQIVELRSIRFVRGSSELQHIRQHIEEASKHLASQWNGLKGKDLLLIVSRGIHMSSRTFEDPMLGFRSNKTPDSHHGAGWFIREMIPGALQRICEIKGPEETPTLRSNNPPWLSRLSKPKLRPLHRSADLISDHRPLKTRRRYPLAAMVSLNLIARKCGHASPVEQQRWLDSQDHGLPFILGFRRGTDGFPMLPSLKQIKVIDELLLQDQHTAKRILYTFNDWLSKNKLSPLNSW